MNSSMLLNAKEYMESETQHLIEDDEISLLDILVVLAESWRLLVFGPLLAGLVAAAVSFALPKTYESVAILRLSEDEAAFFQAAPVQDALLSQFEDLAKLGETQEDRRNALKKLITANVDKKTKLVTLTAKSDSPDKAQDLGEAAIKAVLSELIPRGRDRYVIEQTIIVNEQSIKEAQEAIEGIKRSFGKQNEQVQDISLKYFAALNTEINSKRLANLQLKNSLQERAEEIFVQYPNFPEKKAFPKKSLIVFLTVLASGFMLILWVFVRNAWYSNTNNPDAIQKIQRIRHDLGLRP
jgi:LPS O-antigen subunit length determinant protein (WzzB/FepE family)